MARLLIPSLFFSFAILAPLNAQDAETAPATATAPVEEAKPALKPLLPLNGPILEALPSGAIAFAESSRLDELIAAIKNSPAYQTVLESEQFKEFQESEEFKKLQNGLGLAKLFMQMDLWEAGEKILGGQVALAVYPKEKSKKPDLVFLLRPGDPSAWGKQRIWTDPALGLSAKRVERKRFSWGLKIYETKGEKEAPAYFALHKQWMAISSSLDLLEQTISLQLTNPQELVNRKIKLAKALKEDAAFTKMAKTMGHDHLARVFVDVETISNATGGRLGLPKKMDNPLGSLLAGGIFELAAQSTYGTITLNTDEESFALEASFDGDPSKLDKRYQVFFSDHPKSGTTALPEVPGLIGGFTLYRDIATWYRSRDDLLIEDVLPEFDKFEAGIGNLLPGKDLGEDVFPLVGNNITFVSALQSYDHLEGEPGIQIPGFAFIIDLEEPEKGSDIFQLFFQTLLAVLNLEAGKQNRQPWLIDVQLHDDTKITSARYLEDPKGEDLPIVFNFLPASARVGDKYIVSSSLELCRQLVDALKKPASAPLDKNLHFEVRFQPLAKILAANSEHFEAQRVGEGRTAKQAKADVDLFLTLLRGLGSLSTSTSTNEDGFKLRVQGRLNQEATK